jgi:hypothetical protein
MAKPVGTGTFSNLGHTQALRGRQCDQAKVRELPSWPGAQKMMPYSEAEYMTATGSPLTELQYRPCARERSIYVCGELLISVENRSSPHKGKHRCQREQNPTE